MIDDLERFLRLAALLEAGAAEGYARLAEPMRAQGNTRIADMFSKFGEFSRLHLAEVHDLQRAELGRVFAEPDDDPGWPAGYSPENPMALAPLADVSARGAIEMALETERRACDFYSAVAGQRCERVQELAQMFVEEEAEHVQHLERWLEREDAGE